MHLIKLRDKVIMNCVWYFETLLGIRIFAHDFEVKDIAPFVVKDWKFSLIKMFKHLVVLVSMTQESYVLALLNHRRCHREKHDLEVFAISKSQLLARDYNLAVLTLPKEVRPIGRSKHNNWILDLVTQSLLVIIMQVDVALINVSQVHWVPI